MKIMTPRGITGLERVKRELLNRDKHFELSALEFDD
jgi:hypothetical protein